MSGPVEYREADGKVRVRSPYSADLARLTDGVECRPVAISMHHAGPHFQV